MGSYRYLWIFALLLVEVTNCATLTLNFAFSGSGASQDGALSYSFSNNSGLVVWNGRKYAAMAYYTQEMGSYKDYPNNLLSRWIDYVAIAQDGSDLVVGYIDCDPQNLAAPVGYLWLESLKETLFSLDAGSGTCSGFVDLSRKLGIFPVTLPALAPSVPITPRASTGIKITGSNIVLSGSRGWLLLPQSGGNWSTTLLSKVDCYNCISNCLECRPGPWFELHFIATPSTSGPRTSYMFGIYYLFPADRAFVQLNYTIALPWLQTPSLNYDAHWEGKL